MLPSETRFPPGARPYRLSGAGTFEALFREGERREGRFMQLVSVRAAKPLGRAGFVVSRKALPRAVDRNRLKRLLREMLRAARPAANALDIVIRLKRPVPVHLLNEAAGEAARLLAEAVAASAGIRR